MSKPQLTAIQIQEFKNKFEELVSRTPKETQELWVKKGSISITRDFVVILPTGFEKKFHRELASEFVDLLNSNSLLI